MDSIVDSRIKIDLIKFYFQNLKEGWSSSKDEFKLKFSEWITELEKVHTSEDIITEIKSLYIEEISAFRTRVIPQIKALIMKGGGIKGLAYVGALEEITKHHSFNWYAGTSAGAISAILLGSGYKHEELAKILDEKDFRDFLDSNFLGVIMNLFSKSGLYQANSFRIWLDDLLATKLSKGFEIKLRHLPTRVSVYATRRDKSALIFDSYDSNKDVSASYAARCSMSIPLFFTPQKSEGLNVFDGGVKHNFPVMEILKTNPEAEFIGLYLGREIYQRKENNFFRDLLEIWTESYEPEILEKYEDKIVIIDTFPISTYSFHLSKNEKRFLLECGRLGAINFLHKNSVIDKSDYQYDKRKDELELVRKELISTINKNRQINWVIIFSLVIITLLYYLIKMILVI